MTQLAVSIEDNTNCASRAPCLGAERNRTHSYIGKYWNSFRPFRKEQTITNHRPTDLWNRKSGAARADLQVLREFFASKAA